MNVKPSYVILLKTLIAIIFILGIFFRFVNLDRKPYWHDEVFTSYWLAGHTSVAVEAQVANGKVIAVADLQKYQHLDRNRSVVDTVKTLAADDPQHPPLYYAIARLWVGWQSLNPLETRIFSALISLLVFPCFYWLCLELFDSPLVGWMGMTLLAISPFHVLYAQEARQYSFWTVTILLASAALLRAIRLKTTWSWITYGVGVSLVLYSQLLSFLLLIGHSIYFFAINGWRLSKDAIAYIIVLTVGVITFVPWLVIIEKIKASGWTGNKISLLTLAQRWIFNINTIIFDPQINYPDQLFEVRSGIDPVSLVTIHSPFTFLVIPIFILSIYAIYFLIRQTPPAVWLFIIVLIGSTGLLLGLPDLIVGGQRSSITRYQIPCLLGIEIAMAYLLTVKIKHKTWQLIAISLISLGILSCTISSQSQTWWNKYSSYYDPQVAAIINQTTYPLVISGSTVRTSGLSYLLNPQVKLLLVTGKNPPTINIPKNFSDIFLYQASDKLLSQFQQQPKYQIKTVHDPGQLWRIIIK